MGHDEMGGGYDTKRAIGRNSGSVINTARQEKHKSGPPMHSSIPPIRMRIVQVWDLFTWGKESAQEV
eukprot:7509330-Prorocentrum_lima.AAC.1